MVARFFGGQGLRGLVPERGMITMFARRHLHLRCLRYIIRRHYSDVYEMEMQNGKETDSGAGGDTNRIARFRLAGVRMRVHYTIPFERQRQTS